MPRLFTGLEIPPEFAERLALYRGGLPGARWIELSDLHLTLRFLGDVSNDVASAFHEALEDARPRGSVAVSLAGLGSFGGDRPRAIIASVEPNPELAELQSEHERIARRSGLDPERRKFTPHVTIARLNRSVTADAVARYVSEMGVFPRTAFTARDVALFSARDSRGGGPYVVEARYPLALA